MNKKVIDKLFTQGRHIFCSTIISQQAYRMASSTQRSQATLVIYGKPRSELDWKKFAEENDKIAGGDEKLRTDDENRYQYSLWFSLSRYPTAGP